MEEPAKTASEAERRRILVRRICSGDHGETTQLHAYCPDQGRTMPLEECANCARCQGFSLDPTWRNSFLLCRTALPCPAPGPLRAEEAADPAGERTPLSQIMGREVLCVTPELTLEAFASLLLLRGISGAPVVDEAGRPVGMVSKTDLVRRLHEHTVIAPCKALRVEMEDGHAVDLGPGVRADWLASTPVKEIMMPTVFSLREDTPVARAAALMALEGVHRIPVTSMSGEVVGLVSALDVLRWVAERAGYLTGRPAGR